MSKYLNLNTLQTLLSALNAGIIAFLLVIGCTLDSVTGKLDCSHAMFSPATLMIVAGIVNGLKFIIIPLIQPGGWVRNLFEHKAVVTTAPVPGTVPPTAVKQ